MKNSEIFVALVEAAPLAGCELDPVYIAGAFVRCYVPASSSEEAILKVRETLAEHALSLTHIEWCVAEDSVEWESPDDETGNTLINEARETQSVVFGEFHTWGYE